MSNYLYSGAREIVKCLHEGGHSNIETSDGIQYVVRNLSTAISHYEMLLTDEKEIELTTLRLLGSYTFDSAELPDLKVVSNELNNGHISGSVAIDENKSLRYFAVLPYSFFNGNAVKQIIDRTMSGCSLAVESMKKLDGGITLAEVLRSLRDGNQNG